MLSSPLCRGLAAATLSCLTTLAGAFEVSGSYVFRATEFSLGSLRQSFAPPEFEGSLSVVLTDSPAPPVPPFAAGSVQAISPAALTAFSAVFTGDVGLPAASFELDEVTTLRIVDEKTVFREELGAVPSLFEVAATDDESGVVVIFRFATGRGLDAVSGPVEALFSFFDGTELQTTRGTETFADLAPSEPPPNGVPEPASLALALAGLTGIGCAARRHRLRR